MSQNSEIYFETVLTVYEKIKTAPREFKPLQQIPNFAKSRTNAGFPCQISLRYNSMPNKRTAN